MAEIFNFSTIKKKWVIEVRATNFFIQDKMSFSHKGAREYFYETLCSTNFFVWTSPIWCSWGSPGGQILKKQKLIDKYHKKITLKNN